MNNCKLLGRHAQVVAFERLFLVLLKKIFEKKKKGLKNGTLASLLLFFHKYPYRSTLKVKDTLYDIDMHYLIMELGAHRGLKVFGRSVVVFEKEGCFNTLMVIESLYLR